MLELPEVEVLRRDLEKDIVGKRVKDVTVKTAGIVKPYHRNRPEFVKALEGRKIEGARRRGTALFLDLDEELTWLLELAGNASVHRETANESPGPDTHLVVTFTTGGALHLSEPDAAEEIHTGVVPTEEALALAEIPETGFDPVEDQLTWMDFGRALQNASTHARTFLRDPQYVLGIGDVYADEILYEAGLRHNRPTDELTSQEIRRLYRSMQEVLQAAMKARGTSLDDVEAASTTDDEGEAAAHLKVYGREGLPSPRSRQPIVRERIRKGTYTYYDPQSQI